MVRLLPSEATTLGQFAQRAGEMRGRIRAEVKPGVKAGAPPAPADLPARSDGEDESPAAEFDARVRIDARKRSIAIDGVEAVIKHDQGFKALRLIFEARGTTVPRKKIHEIQKKCPQRIRSLMGRIDRDLAKSGCPIRFTHLIESIPGTGGGYFATFRYVDSLRGAQSGAECAR